MQERKKEKKEKKKKERERQIDEEGDKCIRWHPYRLEKVNVRDS